MAPCQKAAGPVWSGGYASLVSSTSEKLAPASRIICRLTNSTINIGSKSKKLHMNWLKCDNKHKFHTLERRASTWTHKVRSKDFESSHRAFRKSIPIFGPMRYARVASSREANGPFEGRLE
ncbi:hypothetical protein MESS4_560005 [Mesorhizobium sp. STM 4661]|nr:hypothetical protein MESS4_560005 [Mesorhizobium sp. STM 4661]